MVVSMKRITTDRLMLVIAALAVALATVSTINLGLAVYQSYLISSSAPLPPR
jgi:hypothetical protein